jgi:recombinational DNA repair protein RecT
MKNYNDKMHKVMLQIYIHNSFLQKYKQKSDNMFVAENVIEREFTKQQRTTFILAWSSATIKESQDKFHYNFKEGMQAHPLRYQGVNLGWTTHFHK